MDHPVIACLMKRRAAIAHRIAEIQIRLEKHEAARRGIDDDIRSNDPGFDFNSFNPARPVVRDDFFGPGETPVVALEVLKDANVPMTTTDITWAMLQRRGSPPITVEQFGVLNRKVVGCLNTKAQQGILRKRGRVQGSNHAIIWELLR